MFSCSVWTLFEVFHTCVHLVAISKDPKSTLAAINRTLAVFHLDGINHSSS